MFPKREYILLAILILFHTIGLCGMLLPDIREEMLAYSSMNLYLTFVVLMISGGRKSMRYFIFVLMLYLYGMSIELIGVHTGILFGQYQYGASLGSKFLEVPYVLGINWVILVISCSLLSHRLIRNMWGGIILAALLMTGMDFLIEPVAIASDYWSWSGGEVPWFNYLCWFLLAIPPLWVFRKFVIRTEQSLVGIGLCMVYFLFFGILNLCL
ncbi:MAG: carotenoid biosynthesis protein [Bacteroidetes bacterium]|nr:MAG: carotenoid biosynthesis protein [Bacteroidota bacterium]